MKRQHIPFGAPLQTLEDGLLLRRGKPEDAEQLFEIERVEQSDDGVILADGIGYAVRDQVLGRRLGMDASNYTVVEDTATGAIVSCLCYVPLRLRLGNVDVLAGQIEFVSTDKQYRRRGLVRRQIDIVHQWSRERGDLFTFINGIPWYYKKFGYEYGLTYRKSYYGYISQYPLLPADQTEQFSFQEVTAEDEDFLYELRQNAMRRYFITDMLSREEFHNVLFGRHIESFVNPAKYLIKNTEQQPVGAIFYNRMIMGGMLSAQFLELISGVSWLAALPAALRFLTAQGSQITPIDAIPLRACGLRFGKSHPALEVGDTLLPCAGPAWELYVRIPDIMAFLTTLQPILEERIAHSAICGHSGVLRMHWYTGGAQITFADGKMSVIEAWTPENPDRGDAAFTAAALFPLLLGERSYDELAAAQNDCWANSAVARVLLRVLFPKQNSHLFGFL